MEVVYERCCGLDVHKRTVVACAVTPEGRETRTFGTTTGELLELAEWLKQQDIRHVAMESTGVYWKPVVNVLSDGVESVQVVNPRNIKALAGRKTDKKDAGWIADLLRHGLIHGSYVPEREQRELRELLRARRSLVEDRARVVNRAAKLLEGANIKLGSVVSNIVGVSGLRILEALAAGETDPEALAKLAVGSLKDKQPQLVEALRGYMGDHQRFMLQSYLRELRFLNEEIERLDQEAELRSRPFEELLGRLDAIPGVGPATAQVVLAEIGTDMSRFPSAAHLASWARLCPGVNESAGKRKSARTGQGNRWLRAVLVQAAHAASRTSGSLADEFRRIAARAGVKRAAVAVAHTILKAIYYMIVRGTPYNDRPHPEQNTRSRTNQRRAAVRQLERLGYRVQLEAA